MSDVPVQLIVAAFQDEKSADEALKMLKQARREKLIGIVEAAVLRKDVNGKMGIIAMGLDLKRADTPNMYKSF